MIKIKFIIFSTCLILLHSSSFAETYIDEVQQEFNKINQSIKSNPQLKDYLLNETIYHSSPEEFDIIIQSYFNKLKTAYLNYENKFLTCQENKPYTSQWFTDMTDRFGNDYIIKNKDKIKRCLAYIAFSSHQSCTNSGLNEILLLEKNLFNSIQLYFDEINKFYANKGKNNSLIKKINKFQQPISKKSILTLVGLTLLKLDLDNYYIENNAKDIYQFLLKFDYLKNDRHLIKAVDELEKI